MPTFKVGDKVKWFEKSKRDYQGIVIEILSNESYIVEWTWKGDQGYLKIHKMRTAARMMVLDIDQLSESQLISTYSID